MLHTNNPIIKHKAGLLNLAEELVDEGGLDALIDKSRRGANLKNRIDPVIEKAVVEYAIEFPA
ncbi:MAG: helix-turn-helix domain-containing protein, partial [Pseudoalteromonas rhizosphaerae]|uniref:helix-turn-helix domain-containing protein n=1 Tax=Pseudoalteromonas rhizosphaerae TaxID=2518973 RepID=UPI003C771066